MESFFFICYLLLLYGTAIGQIREYIYVSQPMKWTTAQTYCREHYGDLASITIEEENQRAWDVTGQKTFGAFIGLNRTAPHVNTWQWSAGEQPYFTKWHTGEPNDCFGESCTLITQYGWFDVNCDSSHPVLCQRRFTLVNEKKTWDEALKHCRKNYSDLTVESEIRLDQLKIENEQTQTDSVWTGQRFLDGEWYRVNGMPVGSLVLLPPCPVQLYRCAAYNFNTYTWENRDCNEELIFICQ